MDNTNTKVELQLLQQTSSIATTNQTQEEKLYTVKELAAIFGITNNPMQERLNKLGIKPVVEAKNIGGVYHPALYSKTAYESVSLQQQQQQLDAQKAREKKIADTLTSVGTTYVVEKAVEDLFSDNSVQGLKNQTLATINFMMKLCANQEKFADEKEIWKKEKIMLNDKIEEIEAELHDLQGTVGLMETQMTCENYAIKVLEKAITTLTASAVTRNLKKSGRIPIGKVPSLKNPSLLATVWSILDLEFAASQGWFK